MPGMTTSPQLRESPETAKVQGAPGAGDCAKVGERKMQSAANASKPAAILVRRVMVLVCRSLRLKVTSDCSFSGCHWQRGSVEFAWVIRVTSLHFWRAWGGAISRSGRGERNAD